MLEEWQDGKKKNNKKLRLNSLLKYQALTVQCYWLIKYCSMLEVIVAGPRTTKMALMVFWLQWKHG